MAAFWTLLAWTVVATLIEQVAVGFWRAWRRLCNLAWLHSIERVGR